MARKSNEGHNTMICTLVNHLKSSGFISIKADHIGGNQPDQINWDNGKGHIPDVQAVKNGHTHIFEVETSDSIEDAHTIDQFKLFSAAAKQWATHVFYILVPKQSEQTLNLVLRKNGITNAIVWTL